MEKLPFISLNVNTLPQEKLDRLVLQAKIMEPIKEVIPTCIYSLEDKYFIPGYYSEEDIYSGCPMEVPHQITYATSEKKEKKRIPLEEKYSFMDEYNEVYEMPDEAILKLHKFIFSKRTYIKIPKYPAGHFCFPGRIKGDAAYNHELFEEAQKWGEIFKQTSKQQTFITLTCDIELWGRDRKKAYKAHIKERGKLVKGLKRKYNADSLFFTEVTNKGWPHTHIVVFAPEQIERPSIHKDKPRTVRKGPFLDFVKRYTSAKILDVQVAYDGNVVGYLTKYIAKSCFASDGKEKKKDGSLTKHARKEYMTNLFPSLYGYQSFGHTRKKSSAKKLTPKESRIKSVRDKVDQTMANESVETDFLLMLLRSARRADNLISFSTKENIINKCQVKMLFPKAGFQVPKSMTGSKNTVDSELESMPEVKQCVTGCKGCIFKTFYDLNRKEIETSEHFFNFKGFYYAHEIEEIKELYEEFAECIEMDENSEKEASFEYNILRRSYIKRLSNPFAAKGFTKQARIFGFWPPVTEEEIKAIGNRKTKYKKVALKNASCDYIDFDPAEVLK
ncbi:MAG: hypothetical protein J6V57_04795 [Spirochaetaceae bacterium]|nr:hypothetical protein [Spirochaetaceae bacterium]